MFVVIIDMYTRTCARFYDFPFNQAAAPAAKASIIPQPMAFPKPGLDATNSVNITQIMYPPIRRVNAPRTSSLGSIVITYTRLTYK